MKNWGMISEENTLGSLTTKVRPSSDLIDIKSKADEKRYVRKIAIDEKIIYGPTSAPPVATIDVYHR